jgi:hypothetical protein
MKIILAGKFENALIRASDEVLSPHRNTSTNSYYSSLNRYVGSEQFERSGTFVAIADDVLIPMADWQDELVRENLGAVTFDTNEGGVYSATRDFAEIAFKQCNFSIESKRHICQLNFNEYSGDGRTQMEGGRNEYEAGAGEHYLERLFAQIVVAEKTGAYLVASEDDIRLLEEIGNWIVANNIRVPFTFPDLRGKLIDPNVFADGLLNFQPPDIASLSTVKHDSIVRRYAKKVALLLSHGPSQEREILMLDAMIEAHEKAEASAKAKKVFEITSWVVKPLHYVPGLDAVLTIAEDIKDLGVKALEGDITEKEWHLIGVKMTDIALTDYLKRKSNLRNG